MKGLYLPARFFVGIAVIIGLFLLGFSWEVFFALGKTAIVALLALVIVDTILLFGKSVSLSCKRITSRLFSLGNLNEVDLIIRNESSIALDVEVIDELPFQLQKRDFSRNLHLAARSKEKIKYHLRPLVRGEYEFGKVHLFVRSLLGVVERRISFDLEASVAVNPSIMDMKKFELKGSNSVALDYGIKKIRRIGHSYEFEQIKEYTIGDDYKSMNWKATSRTNKLMVNSYTDEKAQQVYCLIDKSRYMKMPFNGLSLLDYSINSSLVIANTALTKQDKAGLVTFSDRVNNVVQADRSRSQLKRILEALYREEESKLDANYERMYSQLVKTLKGRSLVFLFTNFESVHSLERVLPVLRKINRTHLLVVIVFENRELINYHRESKKTLKDVYYKTVAHKLAADREQITSELRHYGIQYIFTPPESLSINAINKYLELKSRGMI